MFRHYYLIRTNMKKINLTEKEFEVLEGVWDSQGLDTKEVAKYFDMSVKEAYRILKRIQDKTIYLLDPVEQLSTGELNWNAKITTRKINSLFWHPANLDESLEDYCKENELEISSQKKEKIKKLEFPADKILRIKIIDGVGKIIR